MNHPTNKTLQSRRRFLDNFSRAAGGAALSAVLPGLMLGMYSQQSKALPTGAIRPPGANNEMDFLSACLRCGLCVRDCPYDTLKLSKLGDNVVLGTPYFEARDIPCEMCEDIPCVKACPSGALDPQLKNIDDAQMGLAVLIDQEACIAFQGLRCEVCYNVCPVRDKAISIDYLHNKRTGKHALFIPVVHSSDCTGCGKCEHACILDEAAIKVLPTKLAKGELGKHYRLGWDEKRKAGKSLVTPDIEHQYNLPKGTRYDYEGEGLIQPKNKSAKTPFEKTALDRLNGGKL